MERTAARIPGWDDLFAALRETEPVADAYDVEWWGPYFIPRSGRWHRSRFMLYDGRLFGWIEIHREVCSAEWDSRSGALSFESRTGFPEIPSPEDLWAHAVPQLIQRLRSALRNPDAHNARVRRFIPIDARVGHIVRKRVWRQHARPPLSRADLARLDAARRTGEDAPSLEAVRVADWFRLVGPMYDAAFPALRGLSPREQHRSRADTRDGGLLALPEDDPEAFREWYESGRSAGCHPWEIVFGHPHGILFAPLKDEGGKWRYYLSVDTEGLYVEAAKMAIALGDMGSPFTLHEGDKVTAALRGTDELEVGPSWGMISVADLRETRPDSIQRIRWDPIPEIHPISARGRKKVEHVLRHGSPAGWADPGSVTE